MTKKDELRAAAEAKGIEVPEGATIKDIEQLLDDAEHAGVVASPETRPIPDSTLDADPEAQAASAEPGAEPVPADHHHEAGLGPELTPAGAHKHAGGLPEHNHLVEEAPTAADVVTPAPNGDETTKRAPMATVTVDRDHTVVFNSQLVELKAGQTVKGELAEYLLAASDGVSKG